MVDPRGCGGDTPWHSGKAGSYGGSPRVRGRPCGGRRCHPSSGWIPAGAGETRHVEAVGRRFRVDPRGCGGDPPMRLNRTSGMGGSPRVRGRLKVSDVGRRRMGWIPAGAGETTISTTRQRPPRVDPRGCGGDGDRISSALRRRGGSPRVRGRPMPNVAFVREEGWIPAGAGETGADATPLFEPRVDPRGCGGDSIKPQRFDHGIMWQMHHKRWRITSFERPYVVYERR